eukprot:2644065-Pleurochrysis_carterae.AAC.1
MPMHARQLGCYCRKAPSAALRAECRMLLSRGDRFAWRRASLRRAGLLITAACAPRAPSSRASPSAATSTRAPRRSPSSWCARTRTPPVAPATHARRLLTAGCRAALVWSSSQRRPLVSSHTGQQQEEAKRESAARQAGRHAQAACRNPVAVALRRRLRVSVCAGEPCAPGLRRQRPRPRRHAEPGEPPHRCVPPFANTPQRLASRRHTAAPR